ncbi:5'/3'-nucleotidase SurE [Longimicrobium sp.]|uniref:5'/3'-nucleotidase SurE n=1 Tax=Longimicrobium sp. TaxID=2029185 RepID=UPI002C1769C4|nr:5'/3'-nucleotidase SurE [Longimicrobium sp.]HSU14366.1 5'/3'-nucleotidase SurE [Longimicrobium sp.]
MLILCTNDDGYLARGLRVLSGAAQALGEVHVVAPDREQSATSHSLTMHVPIRERSVGERTHSVSGTPTDCVFLAVQELLPRRPDFVLSGVNHGMNMGEDVLYSGTVSAAMEATVFGIPAVALSYAGRTDVEHLEAYGPLLERLLAQIVSHDGFPRETLLNVNLPPISPSDVKGVMVTRLGRRSFSDSYVRGTDPSGRPYYWIGGGSIEWATEEGTDFFAIDNGYISVTPLHLDLTNHALIEGVGGWGLSV